MNPTTEAKAKMFLRKALVDSRVAAITVAMLVIVSGANLVLALRIPALLIGELLGTAAAIQDVPYIPHALDPFTRMKLIISALNLADAFLMLGAAWILSRWAYGFGPIYCLRSCRNIIRRTSHVRSIEDSSR